MKYTVVFIFSPNMEEVLMIRKIKGPYPNTLNGIGGKLEDSDLNEFYGAYREIYEESGLTSDDIEPIRFLVKETFPNQVELNVFYTKIKVVGTEKQMEEEKLEWHKTENLLNVRDKGLAGDGNIPYFISYALRCEGI